MSSRKLKVAVLGIGNIATKSHIPAFLSNKHVDLTAIVDIDKSRVEKIAKKFGIRKSFSSVDQLFEEEELDAVSICTPPNTHAELAIKAFKNNVHVLCEKPIATSIDDGVKMCETAKKHASIFEVGFNLRFRSNYMRAKRLVSSGRLGHVYSTEAYFLDRNPLLTWGKSEWFFNPEAGGGVLLDKGPHVFDLLNYFFGDFPTAISAQSSRYFDSSVEDFCVCVLEYPGSRTGIGVMSWLSPTGIEKLSINGSAQNLFVSPDLLLEVNPTDIAEISLWRQTTEALVSMKFPNLPIPSGRRENTHQHEINNFVDKILKNQKSDQSALGGLNVLIECEVAKQSIERKERLLVSPIKEL